MEILNILLWPVVVAAVLLRPLEVRAWRAGKLSDRWLAVLMGVRFPFLVAFACLAGGMALPRVALITAIAAVPSYVLYRMVMAEVRDNPARYRAA